MPNILFASNSISHFPGTEVRNEIWSYNANRVPYSIWTVPATPAGSPIFPATTGNETWFHFTSTSDQYFINNVEPIVEILDLNGATIAQVTIENRIGNGYRMLFNAGGQTATIQKYYPITETRIRTYDLQIKFTNIVAEARLYMNEILIAESTFSVTGQEYPRQMVIGGHRGSNDNFGAFYSEIIVADGDTRNARLDLLRPISAGAYGNWNGAIGTLSDDDPTTGMITTLANQFQSTILTPYKGANNISNIVQITTSVRGINSPTQLQHLIRMNAVDYLTPAFAVPFSKDYQVTDWTQNPATTAPWDAADLSNAEFGFKSIA